MEIFFQLVFTMLGLVLGYVWGFRDGHAAAVLKSKKQAAKELVRMYHVDRMI